MKYFASYNPNFRKFTKHSTFECDCGESFNNNKGKKRALLLWGADNCVLVRKCLFHYIIHPLVCACERARKCVFVFLRVYVDILFVESKQVLVGEKNNWMKMCEVAYPCVKPHYSFQTTMGQSRSGLKFMFGSSRTPPSTRCGTLHINSRGVPNDRNTFLSSWFPNPNNSASLLCTLPH